MPVTLAQELSGWRTQIENGLARVQAVRAAPARARPGRHRGRYRHQRAPALRPALLRGAAGDHRHRVPPGAQLLRGAVGAGHGGGALRAAQGARRQPHENRQRPALDEQRAARGPGRNRAAGAAAGQQHHAGQGESGDPGGRGDGRRAGHRQRCDHHHRRAVGQLPAERDAAGNRLQPAHSIGLLANVVAGARRPGDRRLHRERGAPRRGARAQSDPGHRAEPVIGYEKGAAIAKKAYAEGRPIRKWRSR